MIFKVLSHINPSEFLWFLEKKLQNNWTCVAHSDLEAAGASLAARVRAIKCLVLLMIPTARIPPIIFHWCRDGHIHTFEPLGPWQEQQTPASCLSSEFLIPGSFLGRKKPPWRRGGGFLCWLKARRQPGLDPGKALVVEKRVWGPCEELPLFI